jgi:hypothetical protein
VSKDALLMLVEKVVEKVWTSRKVRGLDASVPRFPNARDGRNRPSPAGFVIVTASRFWEHHVEAQRSDLENLEARA